VKKDGAIEAFEESGLEELPEVELIEGKPVESEDLTNVGRVVYVTKPTQSTETSQSTVTVEGNLDPDQIKAVYVNGLKATVSDNKWKLTSVKLSFEGENEIKIEAEDLNGNRFELDPLIVTYDKTSPSTPVINEPVVPEGEGSVTIEDVEQLITGTVSSDTQAVIVNDYRLAKYVPGSREFKYYAKIAYGNLEAGENEYKVFAEDNAGNQSEVAIIILELDQSVIDEAKQNEEEAEAPTESDDASTESPSDPLPTATSEGGVKITGPNNGESFETTETEFEISGIVPENTAKVVVNDYALSLFKAGDTTFKYRAYKSIGNLEIGKKNLYTIQAFDGDNNLLGQASIMIDVESGDLAAPVITIPSSAASYSTTLDTLVIGGTVGKWVTRIYVNSKEIRDYIPGSEKWRTSVTLQAGQNTFSVTAEKQGETVGKDEIEITYTP